jgi:hypothetical protein
MNGRSRTVIPVSPRGVTLTLMVLSSQPREVRTFKGTLDKILAEVEQIHRMIRGTVKPGVNSGDSVLPAALNPLIQAS